MTVKRLFIIFICLILCVCAVILPTAAQGGGGGGKNDYSRPSSGQSAELDSADILEYYLGTPLSDAERDYLALYGGVTVSYDKGISTSLVVTEHDATSGELKLYAYDYSYVSAGGSTVKWSPVSATVGGATVDLVPQADRYYALLEGVAEEDSLNAYVKYSTSFILSREDLASVVNKAYTDAPVLKADLARKQQEYLELKAKHEADTVAYEAYLDALSVYELENAAYIEFLKQKSVYDSALEEYNKYVSDLAAYEQAVKDAAAYDQAIRDYNTNYTAYRAYLLELSEYESKLAKYSEYLEKLDTVSAQLAVIEAAKTPMTNNRQVYSAIMGSLVTSVLENKDLITSDLVNVSGDVIEGAGLATENLRQLLTYYFSLTEQADKYAYYTINYESFRDNFTLLAQCLDELYRNKRIRGELIYQERDEKYIILVSQLALIANALNGSPISSYYGAYKFDSSYRIEKKSISQILENKTYFDGAGSPVPLEEGYPAPVAEPVAPAEVKEPVRPEPVSVPAYPDEVLHPGEAPATVEKPVRPDEVTAPGAAPVAYDPPAEIVALIADHDLGLLINRAEPTADITITLDHTVSKKLFNVTTATVVFCDTDGNQLDTVTVDSGSFARFDGVLPVKPEDLRANYYFDKWVTDDGTAPDLNFVDADLVLYPSFREELKKYTVTYTVNGVSYSEKLTYGSMPAPDILPTKPSDTLYDYTFAGWDRELSAVEGNAFYEARFTPSFIVPYRSGNSGGRVTEGESSYYVDCSSALEPYFGLGRLLEMAASSAGKGMVISSMFGKVTVPYSTVLEMHAAGVDALSFSTVSLGGDGYRYSIRCYVGDEVTGSFKMSLEAPCFMDVERGTTLSYITDKNETVNTVYSHTGGVISFSLISGREYTLSTAYSVHCLDQLGLSASVLTASAGQTVKLTLNVPAGVIVTKLFYLSDGVETVINGDSFVMPRADVTLGVEYKYAEYKVTFMNGDKVISTAYYRYGDTVIPPKDPSRVNSTVFKYTFKGWSPSIGTVTADAVYRAEYNAEYVPFEEPDPGLQISPSILRLLIAGGIAVGMLILVVIPTGVVGTVLFVRDRRYFKKASRGENDHSTPAP